MAQTSVQHLYMNLDLYLWKKSQDTDRVESITVHLLHLYFRTTEKLGSSDMSHITPALQNRRTYWDYFHQYKCEVFVKGSTEQRNIFSRLLSSTWQNYTFLEWMSDYSHQLITRKLPLCYQNTKTCMGGNSLPTILSMFKYLNLPLPHLLLSLPIWKKLHLPSCHHAVKQRK